MKEEKEVRIRGKAKKAVQRVASVLSCQEKELKAEKEKLGYSNTVFKVTKGDVSYLYKEYASKDDLDKFEIKWQRLFPRPKILYSCDAYRIDEYIEHKTLSKKMLKKREILKELAKCVSSLHQKEIPPNLHITYLGIMQKKREAVGKRIKNERFSEICKKIEKKIETLYEKSLWKGKICICHNDLQLGNILVHSAEPEISLIDFEHMSVNIPTVEIGNLINEILVDSSKKGAPIIEGSFPSTLFRFLIEEYMEGGDKEENTKCGDFLAEAETMRSVSYYYWFLWSASIYLEESVPNKSFDYFSYSSYRLEYLCNNGFLSPTAVKDLKKIMRHAK